MKKLITVIAALWLFLVFAFLQFWFWGGVTSGHGNSVVNAIVGCFVFFVVGVVPVKIIKITANLFK